MAIAINIENLLNKQKIESNRIEFKKGWNPASIYHSVCAFANDFDDLGGGYILVGVDTDDKTGLAIRPVEGIPTASIDGILQDMVGYNNKISPYYMPLYASHECGGSGRKIDIGNLVSCRYQPTVFGAGERHIQKSLQGVFPHP